MAVGSKPDRNLAMELVRATEAAAMAAARWMGKGDRNACDKAAVDAMRLLLASVDMDGVVVIGEGEKDEAPMLYNGERIGNGNEPRTDIAVDPIDGTRLLSLGLPNSVSVVALSERGTMFSPGPIVYMNKIAVGAAARDVVDIDAPVQDNLENIARAYGKGVEELTVVVLDRPRHRELIDQIRAAGARLKLISDGDVSASLQAATHASAVDALMGIGGSPEAVISAAAIKCLGGNIQCKLWPRDESERQRARDTGYDLNRVLNLEDLVKGDNVFFAITGVTDGELLEGVRYLGDHVSTDSLVMRSKSGTFRRIKAEHRLDKLMQYSNIPYES
ncbi:MAG: class II fructose-bisphosphatase [Chloroflexi bacterium]|nr:class II fructose-bisphosphatase [Chloroflexota bacterium]MBI3734310.1 class II fructose-bisphosphatase [Chloroflexota bacterium]